MADYSTLIVLGFVGFVAILFIKMALTPKEVREREGAEKDARRKEEERIRKTAQLEEEGRIQAREEAQKPISFGTDSFLGANNFGKSRKRF